VRRLPCLSAFSCLLLIGSAAAAPTTSQAMQTTFIPLERSLAQLLADGFRIVSTSGEDGEILYLSKSVKPELPPEWIRCELRASGDTKLVYSHAVSSDCRALN